LDHSSHKKKQTDNQNRTTAPGFEASGLRQTSAHKKTPEIFHPIKSDLEDGWKTSGVISQASLIRLRTLLRGESGATGS